MRSMEHWHVETLVSPGKSRAAKEQQQPRRAEHRRRPDVRIVDGADLGIGTFKSLHTVAFLEVEGKVSTRRETHWPLRLGLTPCSA